MRTITLDNFKSALVNAAAQQGAKGAAHVKALMLSDCIVTDAEGNPIPPDMIDVTISPAAGAAVEDMAKPEEPKSDAAEVAKSIRREIRAAVAESLPSPRNVVTSDVSIPSVRGRVKHFKSAQDAYRFGKWLFAAAGCDSSATFCKRAGIPVTKAHAEGANPIGGFLVPDEFEATLIDLREKYGVFRQNAKIWPMTRDTLDIPRKTNGLTAYWTGETKAATESTGTFSNVGLSTKKLFAITTTSSELVEDAVISIADMVADDIAQEFAKKEDEAGFNGDGTTTYGGIVGLANSVGSAGTHDSGIGTAALSGIAIAEIHSWMAKLPAYASTTNAKIYCHKAVFHALFERLAMAAGGVTAAEMQNGIQPRFFGYPVVYSQAMSGVVGTGTNGVPIAYFGDMELGVAFGDRRQTSIKVSDSALNAFEQDELVIRGTSRLDIVCHSVGDASNAGAIVMLTR